MKKSIVAGYVEKYWIQEYQPRVVRTKVENTVAVIMGFIAMGIITGAVIQWGGMGFVYASLMLLGCIFPIGSFLSNEITYYLLKEKHPHCFS